MSQLITSLQTTYPDIAFVAGETFCWSPQTHEVMYNPQVLRTQRAAWSLLHETGHALLQHRDYSRDVELLQMEMAAWDKALEIAPQFDVTINPSHIQDCLDTYRDWLHARSVCPGCTTKSFQRSPSQYRCHNCHAVWNVSPARFARPYRSLDTSVTAAPVFASSI